MLHNATCMFLFFRDNFWVIFFFPLLVSFILLAVGESPPSAATASHWDEPGIIPELHLGSTTGLTHPVSPRIALFLQLLIRKAKENSKSSKFPLVNPSAEQKKGIIICIPAENPSAAWLGEIRKLGNLGSFLFVCLFFPGALQIFVSVAFLCFVFF